MAGADDIGLLPRLRVRVAATGHLIALKVLARDDVTRPQDAGDLRALLAVASDVDVIRARAQLEPIVAPAVRAGNVKVVGAG